jgi:choline dehydrogenase-like flavoprotein
MSRSDRVGYTSPMPANTADIVIIGGGLGGCAAALAATRLGCKVILTEEFDWIGGQLTSQAVPPDEHPWIETHGRTASYAALRELIRAYYRETCPLTPEAASNALLNPGQGWVSGLCCEPRAGLFAIETLLQPAVDSGLLDIRMGCVPVHAETQADMIVSVTVRHLETGQEVELTGAYFVDATELGDLLPLAGVEYVTGAESKSEHGELHAPETADPSNVQALTWCFPMAWDPAPNADHTIARPENYDF